MQHIFGNQTVVIPKNEDSDESASLRIQTNTEKGTVTLYKQSWSNQNDAFEFPEQFLDDIIDGLGRVRTFMVDAKK